MNKQIELNEKEIEVVKGVLKDTIYEMECYIPTYTGKDKEELEKEIDSCKNILLKLGD